MRFTSFTAALLTSTLLVACGDDTGAGGAGGASTPQGSGGGAGATTSSTSATTSTSVTSGVVTASTSTTAETVASSSTSTGAGPLECSGEIRKLSTDVQPIFTASCAVTNCHRGANPDKNLDLSEGAAWAEIVGVPSVECGGARTRVAPSDPAGSYLVHKIRDEELCAGTRRMPPPNRDMLSAQEQQIIVDWICGGALDD